MWIKSIYKRIHYHSYFQNASHEIFRYRSICGAASDIFGREHCMYMLRLLCKVCVRHVPHAVDRIVSFFLYVDTIQLWYMWQMAKASHYAWINIYIYIYQLVAWGGLTECVTTHDRQFSLVDGKHNNIAAVICRITIYLI